MKNKLIAVIGFGYFLSINSPSFASDNLSSLFSHDVDSLFSHHVDSLYALLKRPKPWYEGLKITCIMTHEDDPYPAILCTDMTFRNCLQRFLKLTLQESIEIQNLPKIDYKPLSLSCTNEPLFELSNWLVFNESEGCVISNQTSTPVILSTYYLNDCVGFAIWSSQATVFAHVTKKNSASDTTLASLINTIPLNEREKAKVVFVSGCYSENLCVVYKFLRNQGFRNFAADITPNINSCESLKRYVKASSLNTFLPAYKHVDPKVLKYNAQKYFPLPGSRVLIVNNKTQEVYSLKDDPEKHLETLILDEWEAKYKLREHCQPHKL
jgi:hypothetical protein